jgi:hypothetical protein
LWAINGGRLVELYRDWAVILVTSDVVIRAGEDHMACSALAGARSIELFEQFPVGATEPDI